MFYLINPNDDVRRDIIIYIVILFDQCPIYLLTEKPYVIFNWNKTYWDV